MRQGILELPCEKSVNCLSEIRLIICVLLSAELGLSSVAEAGPPLINYWNVIGGWTQDIWSVVAITFSGARMWLLMGYITLDVGFVHGVIGINSIDFVVVLADLNQKFIWMEICSPGIV